LPHALPTRAIQNSFAAGEDSHLLNTRDAPMPTRFPVVLIGVHVDYRDNHKLFEMVHENSFH
jgi:hypothetical protein